MKNRVLIIGLDGASPEIVFKLVSEGVLENIRKIMENGTYGELQSSIPPHSGPCWASFMTGKNPGKHGYYDFIKFKFKIDDIEIKIRDSWRTTECFWEPLSKNGKIVGILNIPMTYPPQEVNGFMISGLLAPGENSIFTYPSELKRELLKKFDYQIDINPNVRYDKDLMAFYIEAKKVTEKRLNASLYLMEKYDWDLFITIFTELDRIQHKFWHFIDEKHPNFDKELIKKYGNLIIEFYVLLDKVVGELINKTDKDTWVFIISDHGFGPLYKYAFINTYFMKIGMLKLKNKEEKLKKVKYKYILYKLGITKDRIYRILVKLHLAHFSKYIPRSLKEKMPLAQINFSDCDWDKTLAYHTNFGAIYINTNKIKTRKEYEKIRNKIIKKLYEMEDPENGEKIIGKIFIKEDLYHGEYFNEAPDIIALPRNGYMLHGGFNDKLVLKAPKYSTTGTHQSLESCKGIFLAIGPNIKKGEKIRNIRIIDIAPTVLYLFGLPISRKIDGRVLYEIFESPKKREVIGDEYQGDTFEFKKKVYSREEEEKIKERLKNLGYL